MDFAVDLHIHSALSPCGDNDMTPNNIINMALLKGLDIISVTDHNSAMNLSAMHEVAINLGITLVPGIEVQTKEEVHMLCYFKKVEDASKLGDMLYEKLPDIKNKPQIFGDQLILDSSDNIIGKVDKLLLSSVNISIDDLVNDVAKLNGVCIPAHIDRDSFSIITNLGFIPENLNIKSAQISQTSSSEVLFKKYPYLNGIRLIRSSDAHYLWDICERENFITMENLTITNIINYLKGI